MPVMLAAAGPPGVTSLSPAGDQTVTSADTQSLHEHVGMVAGTPKFGTSVEASEAIQPCVAEPGRVRPLS
jgi:hypothetical protein